MSKRTTTRWYIGAWVVWVLALSANIIVLSGAKGGSLPPISYVLYLVMAVAGIVTLITWIGALVKLGTQRAWGWFVGVLVSNLVGLGIIGMVAYAAGGPEDMGPAVMRPTTT